MRILIGGGAGFIGGHFTEAAAKAWPTAKITVLDNLTYAGVLENLASLRRNPRFRFVKGDIADAKLVEKLLKETDLLVNFAAETHVDRSLLEAGVFLKTGAMGTFTLVDTARRLGTVKRLVLMSTDEVYGSVATGLMRETSPLAPSSPYSAAKAAGDLLALSYARSFKLPVIIPRGCNIYGPRQFPEKAVPVFTINALRNEQLPVYGDGRQEREWMHVSDAVRALLLLCRKGTPGEIYNIGTGLWKRNLVVVKRILARLGKPETLIRYVTDRAGHDRRYAIHAAKIHALGWKPRVTFEAGLDTTVDWYRDHEAWWRPLRERTRGYLQTQYAARMRTSRATAGAAA